VRHKGQQDALEGEVHDPMGVRDAIFQFAPQAMAICYLLFLIWIPIAHCFQFSQKSTEVLGAKRVRIQTKLLSPNQQRSGTFQDKALPRKRELPSSLIRSVESLSARFAGGLAVSTFGVTSVSWPSSPEAFKTDSIR
jgi:hypothetical protein